MLNSLALRVDLLNENRRKVLGMSDSVVNSLSSSATAVAEALYNSPESATQALSTKAADLELALEIYQYVLAAHQESAVNITGSSGSLCSTSFASNDSSSSTTSRSTPSTEIAANLHHNYQDQQQQQQQQQK
mmetsp:Transcript_12174/g.22638  ORF Transcript_12174/g.22638 Transcript_12174/m.22638 type:complete len:132 (-) Transcript_12174:1925-2320(-)